MIIILSQDKKNIRKCTDLIVSEHEDKFFVCDVCHIYMDAGMGLRKLGQYATEPRAKEVIREMYDHIKAFSNNPYYEMPQE